MILVYNKSCPECNCTKNITDYVRAEVFCSNCGLVLEDSIIENNPEKRSFNTNDNENNNGIGSPIT